MTYIDKQREIRDYIAMMVIKGRLNNGDPLFEKKYFTSKFKVNPSYVDRALEDMANEMLIVERSGKYYINADEAKISSLRHEFLNKYINDFVGNLDEIDVSIDEAISLLNLRNMANG